MNDKKFTSLMYAHLALMTQEVLDKIRESHGTFSNSTWSDARRLAGVETFRKGREWMMRIALNGDPAERITEDSTETEPLPEC